MDAVRQKARAEMLRIAGQLLAERSPGTEAQKLEAIRAGLMAAYGELGEYLEKVDGTAARRRQDEQREQDWYREDAGDV